MIHTLVVHPVIAGKGLGRQFVAFAEGLAAHGVYTEFHLYPFAGHGGGLNRGTDQGEWSDKAERFMRDERLRGMGRLPDAD